jgi:hypothetical protein
MDRTSYEEDLLRRQRQHLERIGIQQDALWQPCLHDQCLECIGTGRRADGSACVHSLSCSCPKCTPRCVAMTGTAT